MINKILIDTHLFVKWNQKLSLVVLDKNRTKKGSVTFYIISFHIISIHIISTL